MQQITTPASPHPSEPVAWAEFVGEESDYIRLWTADHIRAQIESFAGRKLTPLYAHPSPGSVAGGWQPIETAPTNRPILLWWRTCPYPSVGEWSIDDDFDRRPHKWRSPETGWRNDGDRCIPHNQSDCTHWQPLPAAPGSVPPSPPRDEIVESLDLDDEELRTIEICFQNEQPGRVTLFEIRELVRVYRLALSRMEGQS